MTDPFTDPTFCPNPLCPNHQPGRTLFRRWFHRLGFYETKAFGPVRRYRCRQCRTSFSDQTFALDYFVKKPVSYQTILDKHSSSSGIRAIARTLGVSHQTIINRIARLARQDLALQAYLTEGMMLGEDLVADGFESFVQDQYQPNNIHLLVGALSQFLYTFDYAHLRRKGKMTAYQKSERDRREQTYLRPAGTLTPSFRRVLDTLEQLGASRPQDGQLTLFTDKKKEYQRLIAQSPVFGDQGAFVHRTISSHRARTSTNPLFAVNYFDREIRKDNANHVRESVQFSRDVNNCNDRLAVYQMYHNYMKPYRIDHRSKRSLRHAQVAGISRRKIDEELATIFQERRFFSHVRLDQSSLLIWARMAGNRDRFSGGYWPRYVWM